MFPRIKQLFALVLLEFQDPSKESKCQFIKTASTIIPLNRPLHLSQSFAQTSSSHLGSSDKFILLCPLHFQPLNPFYSDTHSLALLSTPHPHHSKTELFRKVWLILTVECFSIVTMVPEHINEMIVFPG